MCTCLFSSTYAVGVPLVWSRFHCRVLVAEGLALMTRRRATHGTPECDDRVDVWEKHITHVDAQGQPHGCTNLIAPWGHQDRQRAVLTLVRAGPVLCQFLLQMCPDFRACDSGQPAIGTAKSGQKSFSESQQVLTPAITLSPHSLKEKRTTHS